MNMPKPDTFVLVVAALSEKLVQKENECVDLRAALFVAQEDMSDIRSTKERLYDECDDLRIQVDNLQEANRRQSRTISDLSYRAEHNEALMSENARLREEVSVLKYGPGDAFCRAHSYMVKEGGKVWAEGRKIECIKCVRERTGWGLKETKDWCELNGPKFAPAPTESEETPSGTKRSQDLSRSA